MKNIILILSTCMLIAGCEPETFETPKEETLPLKMELEKDTVWSMTGEETRITIVSNKEIEVIYTIEQGEIQLKKKMVSDEANDDKKQSDENNDSEIPGDEETPSIIQSGAKITLQKGKNVFTVSTDKFQNKGVMLHFLPAEKNTSDKNPNHKIQPLQLRVWTSKPDKKEFKVEITHDTPDTLFLQYKPVKFQIQILLSPDADTSSSYYTYEYEIIQGDAIVRIGDAAPGGTKLQPEERKGFYADTTITLYATPLTTEPTWIRILVRKDFGVTRVEGAILHMDYIKPRGLPKISVTWVANLGESGNPGKCITDEILYSCIGDRIFYYAFRQNCSTLINCSPAGYQENKKVKHRIYFKQEGYYVPKQKYRLKVHIAGTQLLSREELSIVPYQGQTVLIDYDSLIEGGYVANEYYVYLDFDINMPSHDKVILGIYVIKGEFLQLRASLYKEDGTAEIGGVYFDLAFAKLIMRNFN